MSSDPANLGNLNRVVFRTESNCKISSERPPKRKSRYGVSAQQLSRSCAIDILVEGCEMFRIEPPKLSPHFGTIAFADAIFLRAEKQQGHCGFPLQADGLC